MTKDPAYMDLLNYNKAPDKEFLFGTDTMGRDIFSMIWYGGRISLLIGGLATVISTFIAVVVGAFSGVADVYKRQHQSSTMDRKSFQSSF